MSEGVKVVGIEQLAVVLSANTERLQEGLQKALAKAGALLMERQYRPAKRRALARERRKLAARRRGWGL
jgi:hypothetical protein